MNLMLLTPEAEVFKGSINAVIVPGVGGRFEILKNHAPLVSALEKGKMVVEKENGERLNYEIAGGFIEVLKNEISVLTQKATLNK